MNYRYPRIVVSGLSGGSGKTILSIGLAKAWSRRNVDVSPFKKGPDYIDSSWLSVAAGQDCHNLDIFLTCEENVLGSFLRNMSDTQVAVIEGNRGLFDGVDVQGTHSTAAMAHLIKAPVVLIVNCTKSTRTMAAVVSGCQNFDPELDICGVVLNRVANPRHERILRQSIEHYCDVPVLGAIPAVKGVDLPERHLGLLPPQEHSGRNDAVASCADLVEEYVDVDRLLEIAREAPPIESDRFEKPDLVPVVSQDVRIGILRDSSFQFYYPENIEALKMCGADVIEISALTESRLPDLDALYIGGGFPETNAEALSANIEFRESLRLAVEDGLPVYAECGGAMYLGKSLIYNGHMYPMAGVFPVVFGLSEKPVGHGYTLMEVADSNPYYPEGHTIRAHEFHYSYVLKWLKDDVTSVFRVKRGYGFDGKRDGLCYKNALATYSHIHAVGEKHWATSMVARAKAYKEYRTNSEQQEVRFL